MMQEVGRYRRSEGRDRRGAENEEDQEDDEGDGTGWEEPTIPAHCTRVWRCSSYRCWSVLENGRASAEACVPRVLHIDRSEVRRMENEGVRDVTFCFPGQPTSAREFLEKVAAALPPSRLACLAWRSHNPAHVLATSSMSSVGPPSFQTTSMPVVLLMDTHRQEHLLGPVASINHQVLSARFFSTRTALGFEGRL